MKIQFGSIIVRGSGKIDGNCVRNYRGQALLTKIPTYTPRITPRLNAMRFNISHAFRHYGTLPPEERTAWDAHAAATTFKDRYGNDKHLSGRELVSYLRLNCTLVAQIFQSPNLFSSERPILYVSNVVVDTNTQQLSWNGISVTGASKMIVYFAKNANVLRNLKEKQLRFAWGGNSASTAFGYNYSLFQEKFEPFIAGEWYTFGFRAISPSGMSSPMFIVKTQAR